MIDDNVNGAFIPGTTYTLSELNNMIPKSQQYKDRRIVSVVAKDGTATRVDQTTKKNKKFKAVAKFFVSLRTNHSLQTEDALT